MSLEILELTKLKTEAQQLAEKEKDLRVEERLKQILRDRSPSTRSIEVVDATVLRGLQTTIVEMQTKTLREAFTVLDQKGAEHRDAVLSGLREQFEANSQIFGQLTTVLTQLLSRLLEQTDAEEGFIRNVDEWLRKNQ